MPKKSAQKKADKLHLTINVGGEIFQAFRHTLLEAGFFETLLAEEFEEHSPSDEEKVA